MAPINTCVLGTGLSGLTFQIPFVLALPDLFTLHSVLERNPSSEGGRVKERFGVTTKIHRSLEDVLADGEIELVIVGTPNATHFEYAKRALGAGKHVLVEKPVVTTVAEARELGELAKSKNLVLYAYQNRRWDSDFLAVKRLLREPASSHNSLGDVVEFESQYVLCDYKEVRYDSYSHVIALIVIECLLRVPGKMKIFLEQDNCSILVPIYLIKSYRFLEGQGV